MNIDGEYKERKDEEEKGSLNKGSTYFIGPAKKFVRVFP